MYSHIKIAACTTHCGQEYYVQSVQLWFAFVADDHYIIWRSSISLHFAGIRTGNRICLGFVAETQLSCVSDDIKFNEHNNNYGVHSIPLPL